MMLISLLIVLSLERSLEKTPAWHVERYAEQFRRWATDRGWIKEDTEAVQVWGVLLLPALLLALIEHWLLGTFLTFLEQTVVLFICIGCPALRATYQCFLKAAERGDLEACTLYTDQLGHSGCNYQQEGTQAQSEGKTFGQHLTWLNYQHYAAVILWFLAFGAPGAVFYTFTRSAHDAFCESESSLAQATARLLYALDFIPVRITAFGLLMMGHFSNAFPTWIKSLTDLQTMPRQLLTTIAGKAEMLTLEEQAAQKENAAVEPKVLVKLAKRNILFLLVVTAALTLVGTLS